MGFLIETFPVRTRITGSKKHKTGADPDFIVRVHNQRPGYTRMVARGATKGAGEIGRVRHLPMSKSLFQQVNGDRGFQIRLGGSKEESQDIRCHQTSLLSCVFRFHVNINGRREHFEWRHSHPTFGETMLGKKVNRMMQSGDQELERHYAGGKKRYTTIEGDTPGFGWKCLRMGAVGDGSSDGKECVASFASILSVQHRKGTKKYAYRLWNSGERGLLGPKFEAMAYLTFIAIWDEERREQEKKQNR